jgi:hypothetical protein
VEDNASFAASIEAYGVVSAAPGLSLLYTGALRSSGWNKLAAPSDSNGLGDGCETLDLSEAPLDEGFYVGDLDFYAFSVPAEFEGEHTLCAIVESKTPSLGWDLLLFEIEACEIAPKLVTQEEQIIGYGMGGASSTWQTPITAGKQYAVLHAGYTVPDTELENFEYKIGLAVLPLSTTGRDVVCPNLPDVTEEDS